MGDKIVFAYYSSWTHYRRGDGQFRAADINPNLMTHLGYCFFGIDDDGKIKHLDKRLDLNLDNISDVISLKNKNPKLKVMAVVGGWNEGSIKYSRMAGDAIKRRNFIFSTLQLLNDHQFDGLDLDWEYPTQRGGSSADCMNFSTLLRELRAALWAKNYLLSVAVGAGQATAECAYDIPSVASHVDFINIMSYDFTTGYERTGHNAPLSGSGSNNIKATIDFWVRQGAPSRKLVLGIPFYGRTFSLENPSRNGVGDHCVGPGDEGPGSHEKGVMNFNEICEKTRNWNTHWDNSHKVPYTYQGNQWISFDNKRSIAEKLHFLKSRNLGGAMVWSIEGDDFRGRFGEKYPLLNAIYNELRA